MNVIAPKLALLIVLLGAWMGSSNAASNQFGPSVAGVAELVESTRAPATLLACPKTPNCVSSIQQDGKKSIAAFELADADKAVFQTQLIAAIKADGGVVRDERDGYVWATYTSSLMRFVDDIEWLFDAEKNVFDVRSASRVGRSDFGVNATRVERLRSVLATDVN